MARTAAFVACLVTCAVAAYALQELVDGRTHRAPEVEMRYLLETENLQRASFGYPQIFADFIWIKSIQFYHQQFLNRVTGKTQEEKTDYKWLIEISDLVTDLNPKFVHAYWFFSLYLGGNEYEGPGRVDDTRSSSIAMLRKGYENNSETYFLADQLAYRYYQYRQRVIDRDGTADFSSAQLEEMLDRYYAECLRFADLAAEAKDAPERVRLAASGYRRVFGGDECEGAELLTRIYDGYTQDVERVGGLFSVLLTLDRCNMQRLQEQAEAAGMPLEPGTAAELTERIGAPLPVCPWGSYEGWIRSGDIPPETVADFVAGYARTPHRFEYFVAETGEVLSWYEAEKRQESQRVGTLKYAENFRVRFGFTPRSRRQAAELLGSELVPNPFGREYWMDLITNEAYFDLDEADIRTRYVPWWAGLEPSDRTRALPVLVRALEGAVAAQIRRAIVEPWRAAHPGEPVPPLEELVGAERVAVLRAPWPLLEMFGERPGAEIPITVPELMQSLRPREDGLPDYIVTPDGDVMARAIAERLREDRRAFLQQRLDSYVEEYSQPPTFFQDLLGHLTFEFPGDPLRGRFALDESGRKVVVIEP